MASATKTAETSVVRAPVLPAPGGGFIVHGRGKPDRQLLRALKPAVARAERTATELRKVIAERG